MSRSVLTCPNCRAMLGTFHRSRFDAYGLGHLCWDRRIIRVGVTCRGCGVRWQFHEEGRRITPW